MSPELSDHNNSAVREIASEHAIVPAAQKLATDTRPLLSLVADNPETAELWKEIEKSLSLQVVNVLHRLAKIERKDEMTRGLLNLLHTHFSAAASHSETMSDKLQAHRESIMEEFGLNEEEFEQFNQAIQLHDIGKLTVPADLLAGGKIEDNEDILRIKQHPILGAKILDALGFDQQTQEIAGFHHIRPLSLKAKWGNALRAGYHRPDLETYLDEVGQNQISDLSILAAFYDVFDAMMDASRTHYQDPIKSIDSVLHRMATLVFETEEDLVENRRYKALFEKFERIIRATD